VIKLRKRLRHVACIRARGGVDRVLMEKPEEKCHLEDPGVDGRITSRGIFRRWNVGVGECRLDRADSG
jgi:hypothetical protein